MGEQKVVVITGGTSGIGKEMAREFVAREHEVIVCGRSAVALRAAADETGAHAFPADVTKSSDLQALADFTIGEFGHIDIWINNAGVWLPLSPVEELDIERVKEIFEPNVFGLMYGSQIALRHLRERGNGVIANIISSTALSGRALMSGYGASKWAARGFTDSLRAECEGSDIRVIGVYPGGTKTALFDEAQPPEFGDYMSVEDVAREIVDNLLSSAPEPEHILRRSSA